MNKNGFVATKSMYLDGFSDVNIFDLNKIKKKLAVTFFRLTFPLNIYN